MLRLRFFIPARSTCCKRRAFQALLASAAFAFAAGTAAPPGAREPLDYVHLGRAVLERHAVDPQAAGPAAIQQLLTHACVQVEVGPIALLVPLGGFLPEGEGRPSTAALVDVLRLAVPSALRMLDQVGRWSGAGPEAAWKDKDLGDFAQRISLEKELDPARLRTPWLLADLLGPEPDKRGRALLARAEALLALPALAPRAEGPSREPITLLVLPNRRDMIHFLCATGVADPAVASVFHQPAITGWMHSYYGGGPPLGRVSVLCLEEGFVGDGATERWADASQETDRLLVQHTITYDALVAFVAGLGPAAPNWLALGLGFQGVMDQYGSLAGRLGADSVGDVTPPRQAFVPGGQSSGGRFPPNLSALRGTFGAKELLQVLEQRKQAAYALLQKREAGDPQRKAAQSGDEAVFLNFRNAQGSEEGGYLHFGPYLGQDLSFLTTKDASTDLALTQRALFALVSVDLAEREKGAALSRLLAALPSAGQEFDATFQQAVGASPGDLERGLFAKIKKK